MIFKEASFSVLNWLKTVRDKAKRLNKKERGKNDLQLLLCKNNGQFVKNTLKIKLEETKITVPKVQVVHQEGRNLLFSPYFPLLAY